MDRIVAGDRIGSSCHTVVTCTCSLGWFDRVIVGTFGFGIVPYGVDRSIVITITFGIGSIIVC